MQMSFGDYSHFSVSVLFVNETDSELVLLHIDHHRVEYQHPRDLTLTFVLDVVVSHCEEGAVICREGDQGFIFPLHMLL